MLEKNWRTHVYAVLVTLTVGVGFAADGDFEKRWKEAEGNVTAGPGQAYFKDSFYKASVEKFAAHVTQCAKQAGNMPTTDLKVAVELGAAGQVLTVATRPDAKFDACFAGLVKKDTFPKPPSDRFWVPVSMGFSNQ